MKHGSLFSGIGGFDLAAEWMGWENVFQVEIDPFCQKVLEKNFPNVKRYGDIFRIEFYTNSKGTRFIRKKKLENDEENSRRGGQVDEC